MNRVLTKNIHNLHFFNFISNSSCKLPTGCLWILLLFFGCITIIYVLKKAVFMLDDNIVRIPVVGAKSVEMRFSSLPRTGDFKPEVWQHIPLARSPQSIAGEWWEINLANLDFEDGSYEYEFRVNFDNGDSVIVADPYAEELTRYGGYRGVFHIRDGKPYRIPFSWQNEIPSDMKLPENNELIIYELPMRWVDSPPEGQERQVGLGTFDKALFEHIEYFKDLGINAIEILPVQDSSDTLNWGYGTRFFFAPDIDMGGPSDLKLFIKECHRRGIRVIIDIVMNHSRKCPLEKMAFEMFYLENGEEKKKTSKAIVETVGVVTFFVIVRSVTTLTMLVTFTLICLNTGSKSITLMVFALMNSRV